MRILKLIGLLLLLIQLTNAQVPDTETFTLQNVVDEVNPTTNDLQDCFNDANADYFNPTYEGSKNSLLNFRDYGAHNSVASTIKNDLIVWAELDDNIANNYVGSLIKEDGTGILTMDGNNNSFLTQQTGKLGYSIERTTDYDFDAISTSSFTAAEYSISLWFNGDVASLAEDYLWIFTGTEEGARLYKSGLSGNLILDFYIRTGGTPTHVYQFTSDLATNTFHHVVFTRTQGQVKVYINGVNVWTQSGVFQSFSSTLRFDGYTSHTHFKGKYDQIIVWNRAITQEEAEYVNNDNNGRTYDNIP